MNATLLHRLVLLVALLFTVTFSNSLRAQFSFSDNATNYGGSWTNGSNQGTGYNAWSITTGGGSSGVYIGTPATSGISNTNIGATSFALFGNSGQYVNATRYFGAGGSNVPMLIGDVFTFYWGMNWDCGSSGSKGFDLRADGSTIFNVNNANSATISTTNGNAFTAYGTNAMLVTLTRTSWTQYSFSMTARNGGATYTTTISSSSNINNINMYCGAQQDNNGNRDIFFNVFNFTKAAPYETNFDVTEPRVLTGANNLTKTGAGNLTLTGINTFTGNVIVNANFLIISNDNQLGAVPGAATANKIQLGAGTLGVNATITINANRGITLNNAASTIDVFGANTATYNGIIAGTGGLTKAGPGTLILGGANTYTGTTTVSNNVLRITNASALGANTAGTTVNSGCAIEFSGAFTPISEPFTINGVGISNGGAIRNITNNTRTIDGVVTLGANARINSDQATLTLSSIDLASNTLYVGGISTVDLSSTLTNGSKTTGDGAIFKDGAGELRLRGAFTNLTGTVNLSAGTIRINNDAGLGNTGTLNMSDGTILRPDNTTSRTTSKNIVINGNITLGYSGAGLTLTGAINLNGGTRIITSLFGNTISGVLSNGGLTKAGADNLTLSGANTYAGNTTISTGNLTAASAGAFGGGTDVFIANAATLTVSASTSAASVREAGTSNSGTVILNTGTILTINGANKGSFFQNSISGAGGLAMSGSGTTNMSLFGTQSYTGATTVSGGQLTSPVAMSTSSLTVSGGVFSAGAADILGNTIPVTVNSGTYQLGGNETIGSLAGTAGTVNMGTSTLTTGNDNTNTAYSGVISGTGGLTKNGTGTFTLDGTVKTFTGNTTVNNGTLTVAVTNVINSSSNLVLTNGTFNISSGANLTLNSVNMTGGAITRAGNNSFTLNNSSSFTGGTVTYSSTGSIIANGTTTLGNVTFNSTSNSATPHNTIRLGGDIVVNNNTTANFTNTGGGAGVRFNLGDAIRTINIGTNAFLNIAWRINSSTLSSGGIIKTGAGRLTITHESTLYTGPTTVTAGELRLNPVNTTASWSSPVTLNGGTLATTGIAANTTITNATAGVTLNVNANSTINLGNVNHSIIFANSSAVTWNGTALTIFGWTGTNGTSGTNGKIYFGNNSSGLTADQLSKITFDGYASAAILLNTGELVPANPSLYFRTVTSGDWATPAIWEAADNPSFTSAFTPTYTPNNSNSLLIQIRNGHTVTINNNTAADDLVIDATGVLTHNSGTLIINNGSAATDLLINGTFNANAPLTINSGAGVTNNNQWQTSTTSLTSAGSSITQSGTAIYNHAADGGNVPASTWANGSTLKITGLVGSSSIGGMNQTFHHVEFQSPSQNTASLQLSGAITAINGNLSMLASGTREVRLFAHDGNTNTSLTVGGNLIVSGGQLALYNSTNNTTGTSQSVTLNVGGKVVVNGGTLNMTGSSANTTTGTGTMNISDSLRVSGTGSIVKTQVANSAVIRFNKTSGTQIYYATSPATAVSTNPILWQVGNGTTSPELVLASNFVENTGATFTVQNNAILNCGTNVIQGTTAGSTGTFILNSGGTLKMGSANGITTPPTASGNIQTNTRTFDAGGIYEYNGSVDQSTGNGLPATIARLIVNNSGPVGNNTVTLFNGPSLTLSNPSNSLRLTSGLFSVTSTKTVNMPVNGTIVQTAGDFASGSLGGTVSCPSSSTVIVSGAVNFWSVTTTGGIDFGASPNSSTINGTFTLNSGGFVANTNAPFYATNSNLVYATSYTRFDEWRSTTGRGYPFNVIINASQTFNLQNGAGDNTPRQIAGSLTLNAASIFNMNATTGSLTVLGNVVLGGGGTPNTTLSLSTNIGGDMIVGGNWQNGTGLGGVIFNTNNRSVSFSGGAPQTIGGLNSTTFSYLDINNTTNVTLNINTNVATELRLNNGKLILGANNLSLNAFANIVNASSSRYVVTDGAGQLIQSLGGVNTLYPVGPNTTNFAPAILAQFGTVDNIGVLVKSAPAFDNAVNDVLQMVNYQWYISEGTFGGNSMYTQFQWGGADEATNFIRTNPVFHGDWTGSSYNIRATNSTVGGNPYSSGSSTNYSGNLNRTFVVGNLNGIKGCISSVQNGDWNTSTTWEAGVIPPKDANVCLNHNVTINTVNPDTVGSIVFGAASNLTVSNGYTITMSNGGFLNNAKPGLNLGSGKVVFSGTGAISGTQTITFNDVDINNGLTVNTTPTINGVFRINSGGFLITNTVNYSPTSTLTYNTGGTYGRGLEWSAPTGAGYPNNVQLSGNTLLNLGNGGAATARQLAGNLSIDGGSGLTMAGPPNMTATLTVKGNLLLNGSLALSNSAGGDFVLEGNWERNGTTGVFTSNNRAVFFTGLTNQHVRVIGGGIENFAYLLINKPTAGTYVRMFNTTPDQTDLRITGTSGAVLQLLNNGGLDINGRMVGIDQISNSAAPAVWIEVNGAREIINSAGIGNGEFRFYSSSNPNQPTWYTSAVKNVSGVGILTFEDNVLMTIADGACDFGVSAGNPITFIKGVLQVKLGASVGQTMNSCFYATGSTLRFANTVDYQIPANDKTWASGAINSGLPGIPYNVEILDNGTDLTLNSARALKNNLTITNGTFTINTGAGSEFSLGGNWSRSGVSSAFNNNAGARVVFRGTSPQTITSTATGNTETFREFEISNSGGVGNNTLTLAGSTRLLVTDSIIFTQGIITTGTNRVETNASTVYVAGAGNTNYTQSWINGNLRRNINASNTTIEFPVGLATRGNLAVLTNNNLTGISFFDADFHPVAGGNNAELSAWETSIPGNPFHTQYTSMNSGGFWSIEPNAQPTSGTYDLRLYFNGMLGGMVDNQFGILKRNNGSATYADFKPFPGTSINASNGTGRTIAGGFALRMGYTSFSEFGIGLSGVPLPVQLTTFSGYNEGSVNKLNWNTSSELNSMEFQIERSADGINFQHIGTEAAAGFSTQPLNYNFTDVSPLNGVNYYRLKMVDMDYTYTYSNIIAINPIGMTLGNDIILFPNPSTDNVFANITTVDRREINIVVIDISGRLIMTNRVQLSEGNHIIPIGTSALAGGNYIIEFRDQQNNLINSKKFIKKN